MQLCVPGSLVVGNCDHLYSEGAGSEMQKDKCVQDRTQSDVTGRRIRVC